MIDLQTLKERLIALFFNQLSDGETDGKGNPKVFTDRMQFDVIGKKMSEALEDDSSKLYRQTTEIIDKSDPSLTAEQKKEEICT